MDKSALNEFSKFLEKEITPALDEIENLEEANRKHLQKLVYTNIVNRFDSMIDQLLLENCRNADLIKEAEKSMQDQVSESELLQLLMESANLESAIDKRLQKAISTSILRKRHSIKLQKAFNVFQADERCEKVPRVNISTGKILEKIKPQNIATSPYSICGYADWLYSRRNSLVHGSGTSKFLENDRAQLKKLYGREPAKSFKVSLGSVQTATVFYGEITRLLLQ